jgi:phytoene desaturase
MAAAASQDALLLPGVRTGGRARLRPHAVVIGSGFGGLAAAIRLGARGYRVTVLERRDAAGGRAYVIRDKGFTFDSGPTIITAPFLFEELWQLAGRRMADDVELRALAPAYELRFSDGYRLACYADAARMRAEIAQHFPHELAGYDAFMKQSAAICAVAFEQLGHRPFNSVWDMLRLVPQLVRLRAYRSVHGLVASYVRDARLRFALSFHPLFVGGNPFTTTAVYGLIAHLEQRWGVHFAMGGTGSLVQGLVNLIGTQGNEILYNSEVTQIVVEGRRARGVRLASGACIDADLVVSNADSAWTYRHLLSETPRRWWTDRRVAKANYSMGLFVWYFGTNRAYPEVPHHSILVGPRYEALLTDIFAHKRLAQDFSLYLHRPTATDPSLAPPGGEAFYVLAPVPNLQGDTDWALQAEPYRKRIEEFLEAQLLPGLAKSVVTSHVMTPRDFRTELLAYEGAAFGMEPLLTQSAWFRPHNRSEDIEHLYLVGAGTHPGAGLPGVLSSARVLDQVVPDANCFAHRCV